MPFGVKRTYVPVISAIRAAIKWITLVDECNTMFITDSHTAAKARAGFYCFCNVVKRLKRLWFIGNEEMGYKFGRYVKANQLLILIAMALSVMGMKVLELQKL